MERLAFVFPGQGSQTVGMLADLAEAQPQVRETFSQASAVLGYDLWELVQTGTAETLNCTTYTQPAMLTAGVAVWRVWRTMGGQAPAFMAGHSLGEYTALVCAGALEFEAAVALVVDRSRYMLEAVPLNEGAMAAILGLSDEKIVDICEEAARDRVVEAANFNAPGQVVIAGHADAVARAVEKARERGAKRAVTLAVSVPSHCCLMKLAGERLRHRLAVAALQEPLIPVVNNVDVAVNADPQAIRDALARQTAHPVRWVQTINWLKFQGVDVLVECGPGRVLAGLTKRIDKSIVSLPVHDSASLEHALRVVEGA